MSNFTIDDAADITSGFSNENDPYESMEERAYSDVFDTLNFIYGKNTFPTETTEQFNQCVLVLDEMMKIYKERSK